ncbi:unnamed protein product [Peronospora destructor]|uniref:Uncharacterized protein n=1 Tax=Peronospora destructor TaxID=86335 RepID=A0AAV0V3P5_9STRA|nr:unnamed protein product [Peronospora destructor]
MGRSNSGIAVEFFKLELVLIQTADDAVKCVKTLKTNLSEFDIRHNLHVVNTSKFFMRDSIRVAKDAASQLNHMAEQIARSKCVADWEITEACNKKNALSDAMQSLKKAARTYDEMNGKSRCITRIIDNVLVGKYDKKDNQDNNMPGCADTVEIVVRSTLRNSFNGFSALKHQISTAEKSLSPSLVQRAKEWSRML